MALNAQHCVCGESLPEGVLTHWLCPQCLMEWESDCVTYTGTTAYISMAGEGAES